MVGVWTQLLSHVLPEVIPVVAIDVVMRKRNVFTKYFQEREYTFFKNFSGESYLNLKVKWDTRCLRREELYSIKF